ncbi:MAG: hypothetical protein ACRD0L_16080 [Acidimicrobiales bacterium]
MELAQSRWTPRLAARSRQAAPARLAETPRRTAAGLVAATAAATALLVSACGGPSGSGPASAAGPKVPAGLSCASPHGPHEVAVVVEPSSGTVISRCVSVPAAGISALSLLRDSKVETATQKYSFGLAVCQVAGVPAHYTQCLPPGKPYWVLFVSHGGHAWTAATTGISDVTLAAGDSLGFRYDSPHGSPAPPSAPPPLR